MIEMRVFIHQESAALSLLSISLVILYQIFQELIGIVGVRGTSFSIVDIFWLFK
jgi:hypothetical protein